MSALAYHWRRFNELTAQELYDILRLRSQVFVVEQDSVYQDLDHLDQYAIHLLAKHNGQLAGYIRILPAGWKYPDPSFGRLVVDASYRGHGLGHALTKLALGYMDRYYPGRAIRIEAQAYLQAFYQAYGFLIIRGPYMLDGIQHLEMRKSPDIAFGWPNEDELLIELG